MAAVEARRRGKSDPLSGDAVSVSAVMEMLAR